MSCGSLEFILFGFVEHLGYAELSVLAYLRNFQPLFLQVFFLLPSFSFPPVLPFCKRYVSLRSTGLLISVCPSFSFPPASPTGQFQPTSLQVHWLSTACSYLLLEASSVFFFFYFPAPDLYGFTVSSLIFSIC